MTAVRSYLDDLIFLFFPEYCAACSCAIPIENHLFCLDCLFHIPYTDHFTNAQNDFMLHFIGRQKLDFVAALFEMQKGGRVHHMLSRLKYKKRRDIGFALGEMFAEHYLASKSPSNFDLIIPVPMHYKKLRKRGFNQSEVFANGISKVLDLPVITSCLTKASQSESQTLKNRNQRLENVFESFVLNQEVLLENKHILLVDDIITTGATLEACILRLHQIKNIQVSLGAIAITV